MLIFFTGNGPNLGGKYHRKLNTRTFLTMSGSMQLYRGSVTPGLQISLANHLSRRLKGKLNKKNLKNELRSTLQYLTKYTLASIELNPELFIFYFKFSNRWLFSISHNKMVQVNLSQN